MVMAAKFAEQKGDATDGRGNRDVPQIITIDVEPVSVPNYLRIIRVKECGDRKEVSAI